MNIAEGTPKKGSIGVLFSIDCGEDISTATTSNLIFVKPDGSAITVVGTITDTQYLTYTTTADDDGDGNTLLDQEGTWRVTSYIVMTGFTGYGDTCYFQVEGEYE